MINHSLEITFNRFNESTKRTSSKCKRARVLSLRLATQLKFFVKVIFCHKVVFLSFVDDIFINISFEQVW